VPVGSVIVVSGLGYEQVGNGAERIVLLHGFTQAREVWRSVAEHVVAHLPTAHCLLVDLPGHGASSEISADLTTAARLVTELGGSGIYVGYSLGGRVVLQATIEHPDAVRRAVVVSATAGIDDADERRERATADDALAERLERIGIDAFLDEWLAQPIFRDLPFDAAQLATRRKNTVTGLADSLRRCSQGCQQPLWHALAHARQPLLAIAGSRDAKYVALARRLATVAPHGALRIVDGAGHSVVLERPSDLAAEIVYWITNPSA